MWEKVRIAYETFATSNAVNVAEEESEDAKQLYKECRLAYITIAAQLGELSQTFGNKAVLSSTRCVTNTAPAHNSMGNRVQNYQIKLPPCTAEVFHGDYRSWPSFRDMFTAIYIDGVELSGVERLFYLRQHTRDEAFIF